MNIPPLAGRIVAVLLVVLSAWLIGQFTGHWLPAVCWGGGFLLFWPALAHPETLVPGRWLVLIASFLAALVPYLLTLVVMGLVRTESGWHGFVHLADLSWLRWLSLLSLWPLAFGGWFLSVRWLRGLQAARPHRGRRLLLLAAYSVVAGGVELLFPSLFGWLPLTLGTFAFLVSIDFFLESQRTSLTWLFFWLAVGSGWLAASVFGHTLRLDRADRRELAYEIAAAGEVDTSRIDYPLPFSWDHLSASEADTLLPRTLTALPPGTGRELRGGGRVNYVYRARAGDAFTLVWRETGGYRPPFVLSSLLFMAGLLLSLFLRGFAWWLRFPITRWSLPLYGPPSLRIRIQLAFFGLVLASFLLIGLFTVSLLREQGASWLNWVENILALYAFLLLGAGALGIILANSITDPLVRISRKLEDTRLRNNEPLSWPREDEIGRLVASYNEMIDALDESAARLAASEREGAWRLMARQVAHEIKNPLTPMKLHLQQLQRLRREHPERALAWSERTAATLIEQIDDLSRIATAFSDFARLPEPRPVHFDLREIAADAWDLHRENEAGVAIHYQPCPRPVPVYADRDQLKRVLHNLLRNAVEAMPDERPGEISLCLKAENGRYHLRVTDNGVGVPPELADKIFQPNFTTKSSGTGLGLAMCKAIMEKAGGELAFAPAEGGGAVFWISGPLAVEQAPRLA